jgi:hypothetical protein
MVRLFGILALAAGLTGCIVVPPYGYGYGPAPAYGYAPGYYGYAPSYYGYAPGYYAAPTVGIGNGFGGYWGGPGGLYSGH